MTTDDRDDVMDEIERALGRIEPSAGFQAGVRSRIEAGRPTSRWRAWWWVGGMVAAAVVALIVVPSMVRRRPAPVEVAESVIPAPAAHAGFGARPPVEAEKDVSPSDSTGELPVVHRSRSESARRARQSSAEPQKADRIMATPQPLVPSDRAMAIARLIAFVHAGKSLGDLPGPAPAVDVEPLDPIPVIDIAPIKVTTLEATVAAPFQGESQ